jgi:hypothetical protein
MIDIGHANSISTEAKRISRNRKSDSVGQTSRIEQGATVIRLLQLGYKPKTVAEQQMASMPTVYNWHKL